MNTFDDQLTTSQAALLLERRFRSPSWRLELVGLLLRRVILDARNHGMATIGTRLQSAAETAFVTSVDVEVEALEALMLKTPRLPEPYKIPSPVEAWTICTAEELGRTAPRVAARSARPPDELPPGWSRRIKPVQGLEGEGDYLFEGPHGMIAQTPEEAWRWYREKSIVEAAFLDVVGKDSGDRGEASANLPAPSLDKSKPAPGYVVSEQPNQRGRWSWEAADPETFDAWADDCNDRTTAIGKTWLHFEYVRSVPFPASVGPIPMSVRSYGRVLTKIKDLLPEFGVSEPEEGGDGSAAIEACTKIERLLSREAGTKNAGPAVEPRIDLPSGVVLWVNDLGYLIEEPGELTSDQRRIVLAPDELAAAALLYQRRMLQSKAPQESAAIVSWIANWLRNGPAFAALQCANYDQPPGDNAPDIMHDEPEAIEALLVRLAELLDAGEWAPKPPAESWTPEVWSRREADNLADVPFYQRLLLVVEIAQDLVIKTGPGKPIPALPRSAAGAGWKVAGELYDQAVASVRALLEAAKLARKAFE